MITDEKFLKMEEERFKEQLKAGDEIQIMSMPQNEGMEQPYSSVPDFLAIRERLFFRLVNPAANRKMLGQMPFMEFHDLAVVFYVLLKKQDRGQFVMPICKEQQERWNVSAVDLFRYAKENTPRLFPPSLCTMSEAIWGMVREECTGKKETSQFSDCLKSDQEFFYVLSNDSRKYGASVLLYEDVLQRAAKQLEADLAVIPSSIHEVLLVILDEETNIREFKKMLHSVNMEAVSEKDRLSENIYLYRREKGYLEVAQDRDFLRRAV